MAGRTLADIRELDRADALGSFRSRFALPAGVVYLDGISLGALPLHTIERVRRVTQLEWGEGLVRSWNLHGWIDSPLTVGAKISRLMGAGADEVVVADSTSVNLYRLVLTALTLQPQRTEVLSESGNFPTDVHVCAGATATFGRGRQLTLVSRERIFESITGSTALVVLTHVHYKTGEVYDLARVTRIAHERGALVIWDLSHSVGALPVDLNAAGADFAVGCGYKYLNGGPGAPAFLYVAQRHHAKAVNAISAWMGHANPFDFGDEHIAAPGIRRFLSGTPSIIANSILEAGVELLLEAGIERITAKSRQLSGLFIELVESECAGYGLKLVSPRRAEDRGSHVAFTLPNGYEIMQALIHESVIGDFRAPDVMRFGFAPLYTSFEDVWTAAHTLRDILKQEKWRDPRYAVRAAVT